MTMASDKSFVDYILEQVPRVVRELREMSPVWMHMLETMPDPYKN